MKYSRLLEGIIDLGIKAAQRSYTIHDKKGHQTMPDGFVAGFEACRGKTPEQLAELLAESGRNKLSVPDKQSAEYCRHACFHAQVWSVCDGVSGSLVNQKVSPALIFKGADGISQFLPYHLPELTLGKTRIEYRMHESGVRLPVVAMRHALFMRLPPTSLVLKDRTRVHHLYSDQQTWIQSGPQEVEQHTRQMRRFKGNILIGGLGLGLAVAMLERNPKVQTIVVVEVDRDIVRLIREYLPQVKTTIVNEDLYTFLKHSKRKRRIFDFAFYDIWCSTRQSTLTEHVIPLRRASDKVVSTRNIECWNEDEMLGELAAHCHTFCKFPVRDDFRNRFDPALKATMAESWPFIMWIMTKSPSEAYARTVANQFISDMKRPLLFDKHWKRYANMARI